MDEHDLLTERFEAHRPRLRAVAYRMLGSLSEAARFSTVSVSARHSRCQASWTVSSGWLITVVARVCLNMLQSHASRREDPVGTQLPDPVASADAGIGPEREAVIADSVGLALLIVLDTLAPAERLAFVLHDLFAVSFDEIAPDRGPLPGRARQVASRARRRVRGPGRQREVVDFFAASRGGDFDALLALPDPAVVPRADQAAVRRHGGGTRGRGCGRQLLRTRTGRAARVGRGGPPERSGLLVGGLASSGSPSRTGRSSPSIWPPTRRALAGSARGPRRSDRVKCQHAFRVPVDPGGVVVAGAFERGAQPFGIRA
jgi:RNA polymerase sigma-70 factor (ECF subfamily)